jgi:arylsulfatase A-like enzyme
MHAFIVRLAALSIVALALAPACRDGEEESPTQAAPGAEKAAARSARPNVVLVVIDTARADHFSSYGYDKLTTPHFDAFAEDAVRFEHAYATSSWTVPSHASLFTGLPPSAHQATQVTQRLDDGFETLAELLGAAGYETAAYSNNAWVSHRTNLLQGFRRVSERWRKAHRPRMPRAAHRTNRAIIEWLETRATDAPFFLFINYIEPHWPYRAPQGFQQRFLAPSVTAGQQRESGFRTVDWYMQRQRFGESLLPIRSASYDAELALADDALGGLLHGLRRLGLYDEGLLVVTSDHGENLGDHGHQGHSFTLYESVIRIPLALRPPGGKGAGTSRRDLVHLMDVFATIAALTGIAVDGQEGIGRNLLSGPAPEGRAIVTEYAYPRQFLQYFPRGPRADEVLAPYRRQIRSIRVGNHKLVWGSDGRNELYDLDSDPDEGDDRIEREPELARTLESRLRSFAARHGAEAERLPPPLPRPPMDDDMESSLRALGYIQ